MTNAQRGFKAEARRALVAGTMPAVLAVDHPDYRRERYSVDQAAFYLLVSRSRIYADVGSGALACRKDGSRRYRFSQADLDQWREARRVEARPPVQRQRVMGGRRALRAVATLPLPTTRRFD